MSKNNTDTRLRLLNILRYLSDNTDAEHYATVESIQEYLSSQGIAAERRAIYDDMHALAEFGYDIVFLKGARFGYYMNSRAFEGPELKLLVDSIQSSRFITERKTISLIKKIASLGSVHEAKDLERQVFVSGRVKSMNESVYYNVDSLSSAINQSNAVTFRYFDYDVNGEKVYRQDGERYTVSPFALIWDNENYYLLGYDEPADMMKHFRVDKMDRINILDRRRKGSSHFKAKDLSRYSVMHFGMYHGDTVRVRMRFSDRLSGPVIDRFGKEVSMIPQGDGSFTVEEQIAVSPVFFSWIFSFGTDAEIVGPESVRKEAADYLKELSGLYKD
ncbi:MAG: WYL domain-containing protein [Eubacterium sp.]|nr:WYL domain-containing protein [Eubacterium sp.]MBQ3412641.1 WYL domain-containing protein [Oscillospiraceae bacterium]